MPGLLSISPSTAFQGQKVCLICPPDAKSVKWFVDSIEKGRCEPGSAYELDTECMTPGAHLIRGTGDDGATAGEFTLTIKPATGGLDSIAESVRQLAVDGVRLDDVRGTTPTPDQEIWKAIRRCARSRGFQQYANFIDEVLCKAPPADGASGLTRQEWTDARSLMDIREGTGPNAGKYLPGYYTHGVNGFNVLKAATEVFVLLHSCCGRPSDHSKNPDGGRGGGTSDPVRSLEQNASPGTLRYLDLIRNQLGLQNGSSADFPFCPDSARLDGCLFELIWSYWHEEGMLVQALNAIALRFQNRQLGNGTKPLATFELGSLRPLNNLLWGYIQDQHDQLTVRRRAYEYEHEYGLPLTGKAVGELRPADRRSKFLEAFHGLLQAAAKLFRDQSNLLTKPDTFPLLNAIREVHLLLAEGAHNQFGDLPSTARQEMLIQQWLLAQAPMRQFLQAREMAPHAEPWMGPLDAMKQVMGWTDVSSTHFNNLAVFGELLLLSLRTANWSNTSITDESARNWAEAFRPELQGYIHSYRAVTGVDLSVDSTGGKSVDATVPAVHLQRRLARQAGNGAAVRA